MTIRSLAAPAPADAGGGQTAEASGGGWFGRLRRLQLFYRGQSADALERVLDAVPDQAHRQHDDQQRQRHRALQEDQGAALANRDRVAHLGFGQRAQNHADHHGCGREVKSAHHHAQHADAIEQEQVECALTHAIGPNRGEDQNASVQLWFWHFQQLDPQANQWKV